MIRKHLRIKRIALTLALAAVAAPTAQAAVYLDGPTPGIQAGYIRAASHQAVRSEISVQATVTPLQAGRPGITAAGAALAAQKHTALPVTAQVVKSAGSSFNWSDAGIGASVAFGAALLLLTVVGLGRRNRTRGLASA
jgi:hypothetical protein